jgi:RND family efflux transporter MFP subunit
MKLRLIGCIGIWLGCASVAAGATNVLGATGITEPYLHVTSSAPVPGIVTVRHFEEGEVVKEGQAILELDKSLEEFEKVRRTSIADEKKRDYDSTAVLFEKTKSVSKEDLLKKESDFKVAAAERDIAAEQLRRRIITAPFTGQITEITVEVGEACQAYQPLVRLVDTSRCYFISNLEAKLAARLKLEQFVKLEVETGAAPVTVTGKIIFISPVVDPASGLVKIRVVFENKDGKVRPGLAAKLLLE